MRAASVIVCFIGRPKILRLLSVLFAKLSKEQRFASSPIVKLKSVLASSLPVRKIILLLQVFLFLFSVVSGSGTFRVPLSNKTKGCRRAQMSRCRRRRIITVYLLQILTLGLFGSLSVFFWHRAECFWQGRICRQNCPRYVLRCRFSMPYRASFWVLISALFPAFLCYRCETSSRDFAP